MSNTNEFPTRIVNTTRDTTLSAVIAISGTTSAALDLSGCTLVAMTIPALFTGTEISFQGSFDGTTYVDLYRTVDDALIYTPITAGRTYLLNVADLAGIRFIKLKSNATEIAERTILLLARSLA
jgi:hypothetical protein